MNRWACVCRFGGVGDNLLAAGLIRPLKKMGYMTEVLTSNSFGAVFQHNPYLDKLSVKTVETDLPQGDIKAWQLWIESRAREYDIFAHLSHTVEMRHSAFATMSLFWQNAQYRRKTCAGSFLETQFDEAGIPYDFGPLFYSSEEERDNALKQKKGYFGERAALWVISGTRIDKLYPYAGFAVARLIKELGIPVMVMGGPSEKERNAANAIRDYVTVANGTRDGLGIVVPDPNAGDQWPIRVSLAYAQISDLVISPDTGPAWAVAFEPMPKIITVSHASVENVTKHWVNTTTLHADPNRVPCWPCHRLHDDKSTCVENKEKNGAACISDIKVDTILEHAERYWKASSGNIIHAETAFAVGSQGVGQERQPDAG